MSDLSNIKHLPKICPECGVVFRKHSKWGYIMWNKKIYCSNLCASKNRKKKEFIAESKNCVICGDVFHKTKYNKYTWHERDKCSYGCPQINNITGQRFNSLTAIKLANKKPVKWECICDCGKIIIISYSHLSTGHTKSCGCSRRKPKTHGKALTREYSIWNAMIQRCSNKNTKSYKYYGGRGISVCKRWLNFESFFKDMGFRPTDKHQIDRIDNDGNYEASNCHWATQKEQARNKSTNVFIEFNNKRLTVIEWSEKLNIPAKRIYSRLYMGMPTEKVLSKEIYNNGFK